MSINYLDKTGLAYFWGKIKARFVEKDGNKGLSTNDYTTADRTKLSGIEAGANAYVLPKASASTLGGVMVGSNLSIDENGVLSASGGGGDGIYVVQVSVDQHGHDPTADAEELKDIADHEFSMLRLGVNEYIYMAANFSQRIGYVYYYTVLIDTTAITYAVNTQSGTISVSSEHKFIEEE